MRGKETSLRNGPGLRKRFLYLKWVAYPLLINMYLLAFIEITEASPLEIKPGLQLSERYIENSDSTLNVHSEERVSTATGSLSMVYQPVGLNLSAGYSLSPSYSSGNPDSRYLGQEGNISLTADRPRWSTSLTGKLVSTRFIDQIVEYNQVAVSQNNNYYQKSGSLGGSYSISRISNLSMTYSYTGNIYDAGSLYNSETQSASGSLSYSWTAKSQFAFSGSGNLYSYQNGGRSKSVSAMMDWSYVFSPFTTSQIGGGGGLSSGYYRFFAADAGLTRKFKNGAGQITYSRGINSGGGYTAVPVINQNVAVNVSETVLGQLSGSVSGALGESVSSYANTAFNLRYWNIGISLSYPILKWLGSSLSYNHYDQKSIGVTEDHSSYDQVLISLSSSFLPWRF